MNRTIEHEMGGCALWMHCGLLLLSNVCALLPRYVSLLCTPLLPIFNPPARRYQWPQLTLAAAIMLWCTDQTCSNSNLQAGHAELHRVLRVRRAAAAFVQASSHLLGQPCCLLGGLCSSCHVPLLVAGQLACRFPCHEASGSWHERWCTAACLSSATQR